MKCLFPIDTGEQVHICFRRNTNTNSTAITQQLTLEKGLLSFSPLSSLSQFYLSPSILCHNSISPPLFSVTILSLPLSSLSQFYLSPSILCHNSISPPLFSVTILSLPLSFHHNSISPLSPLSQFYLSHSLLPRTKRAH